MLIVCPRATHLLTGPHAIMIRRVTRTAEGSKRGGRRAPVTPKGAATTTRRMVMDADQGSPPLSSLRGWGHRHGARSGDPCPGPHPAAGDARGTRDGAGGTVTGLRSHTHPPPSSPTPRSQVHHFLPDWVRCADFRPRSTSSPWDSCSAASKLVRIPPPSVVVPIPICKCDINPPPSDGAPLPGLQTRFYRKFTRGGVAGPLGYLP